MELRQLRYFVAVVESGSMGRAAAELGVVTSTLSQQISRLESELSTRLLQRNARGALPTEAGIAFLQQAQLALRHVDEAAHAARRKRLAGRVSVGLAPSTAAVIGLPLITAMRTRYPDVRLHLVEGLSGHLGSMLNARLIDLAIVFETDIARRWSVIGLLDEPLHVIGRADLPAMPRGARVRLAQLRDTPLILPSEPHGLRRILAAAFARARTEPRIVAEIDGLALLLDAVRAGFGATIQPASVMARVPEQALRVVAISDRQALRRNQLASLSDDELSPAALATRVLIAELTRGLVRDGRWRGAILHES